MFNSKTMIFSVSMALIAAGMFVSCGGGDNKKQQLHSVVTVQPQDIDAENNHEFAGQVKQNTDIDLGFKTAGQILKIFVHEGQHVAKGQLLAQLDDKDYKLGVQAAQAQYDQLSGELARIKKLYDAKSVSGNDYDKARYGLEQVSANLQNYKNKVAYTRLYAPENGIVQAVNFDPMEMVNAGTPVFNIQVQNGLEVEVNLPTSAYLQRNQISHATCQINGRSYQLRLKTIVPKADNSQLYKTTFSLIGAGSDVAAGMNAGVNLQLHTAFSSQLTLPESAVFEDGGKSYVWVVSQNKVKKQQVEVGLPTDEGMVTVTSGINGTMTIVKAGVHALTDGEEVKVIDKPTATNTGNLL